MKFFYFTLILFLIFGCNSKQKDISPVTKASTFYVGTYTDGESEGIYQYSLLNNGKLELIGLVATSENPSYLTKSVDNKYLIAVNEISNIDTVGSVESFAIQQDSLQFISKSSSGGAHPCFVSTNAYGMVLTANYTGGNIGLLKLDIDGKLSQPLDIQQHYGKGIHERQDAPHAHSTQFIQYSNDIISIDLGTNELWFSKIDTVNQKIILQEPTKLAMAPGAGPRHLTFHQNGKWIYVLNELNNTISLIEKTGDQSFSIKSSVSILPKDFAADSKGADIHISNDGNFIYASNRGHNSIAILKVNASDGSLNLLGHEQTRGDAPRNFSLSPDNKFLVVANQLSNSIISFERNSENGLLNFIDEIEAPTPVCILF